MTIIHRDDITPLVNERGETIRELASPSLSGLHSHSLAESIILPGTSTIPHHHHAGEEVYYVLRGRGRITLGSEGRDQTHDVGPGDAITIRPGTFHHLVNAGDEDLVILCSCAPAYAPEDFVSGRPKKD
jgi:mannose-6-phosphate isomerase-like protein (cupin superfamily)